MVTTRMIARDGTEQLSRKAQRLIAAHDREVREQDLRKALRGTL